MKFITNIEKDIFDKFVEENEYKSHFLQSYKWGQFAKLEKHLEPYYVGVIDDNNKLIAASLLLRKRLPLGYSYFYAQRGYVLNFEDKELLKFFTNELRKFSKENKAIFVKMDPDIILNQEKQDGEKVKLPYDGLEIYNNLKKIGYKHLGFTKNFETSQPRYTFRIDMNKSFSDIEDSFSKTTKQRIKKAQDLGIEVKIGDKNNIKDFFNLMAITENRKDFVTHELNYYETLYDMFNEDDSCNLFLGIVNLETIINKYSLTLKEIDIELETFNNISSLSKTQNTRKNELTKRKIKLEEDINKYQEISKEYGFEIITNAHFVIEYGNKAWVLYAGNHNILTETCGNYLTYREHIKYYYDKGIEIYDQFGTIGNLENKHLIGLHEFKKKFAGDYIEFIGEFDLITNKLMYIIFTKLVPIYRKIIKNLAKNRRRKHENS